ncbi:putative homeodomain transcription factor [Diplonema papillatum]|nr:putative homeodomain transcription factor [Diplonema papillatum]KAJ9461585.1 putative homeodomain transcription factor [Diplonema papillatum]
MKKPRKKNYVQSSPENCTPLEAPLSPASSIGLARCEPKTVPFSPGGLGSSAAFSPTYDREIREAGDMFRKFLDVDVMKSVADLNCRPKYRTVALKLGFQRVACLPLFPTYWTNIVTRNEWIFGCVLYCLQALAGAYYYQQTSSIWEDVSLWEVYCPVVLLLIMGLIHGRVPHAEKKKRKIEKVDSSDDEKEDARRSESDAMSEEEDNSDATESDDTSPREPESEFGQQCSRVCRMTESTNNVCAAAQRASFAGADPAGPMQKAGMVQSSSCASLEKKESYYSELSAPGNPEVEEDAIRVDAVKVLLWAREDSIRENAALGPFGRRPTNFSALRPLKVPMAVLEIRNAILSSVDHADGARAAGYAGLVPLLFSLVFSAFPTVHRILMNHRAILDLFSASHRQSEWLEAFSNQTHCSLPSGFQSSCALVSIPSDKWALGCLLSSEGCTHTAREYFEIALSIFFHPNSRGLPLAQELSMILVVAVTTASTFVLVRKILEHLKVTERTYHKRYLYAKFFSAITSLRRSQRYNLPHFRLKNVENVMAWLALRGSRAWLKLEPLEIAADSIVSLTFQVFLFLVAVIGMIVLQEGSHKEKKASVKVENFSEVIHGQIFLAALVISYYLLQYMMIGTSINYKYGNSTLLLTEQINLHLRMVAVAERSVNKEKRDKLLLTNKVLELAAKLLKELEGPNKISGLSMNPLLYNITRVMVLSCLSAAISNVLGFSPKLWKI